MKKLLDAILIGLCVIMAFSCGKDEEVPIPPYSSTNTIQWSDEENQIYGLVDELRYEYAIHSLIKDDFMYNLAKERCDQMIETHLEGGELAHNIPWLQSQIEPVGLYIIRENLAYGYPTVEQCVDAWIESTLHVHTMLNENYIYTGIAIKTDEHGHRFYCQVFSR